MPARRHAKKRDGNEQDIVIGLRGIGALVVQLNDGSAGGLPDLLVGYTRQSGERVNLLMEVKDPAGESGTVMRRLRDGLSPLSPVQQAWHDNWPGQVCTVTSVQEAIDAAMGGGDD